MGLIVQKFGGTSVADRICLINVANIIARRMSEGNKVVTVVSAQGDATDRLLASAREITDEPNARELDALLATGEQASAALLAITLNSMGVEAVSLTGGQAGILANDCFGNGEIQEIDTDIINQYLKRNVAVIITGFQGVNKRGEVITLGRGGSDASAVALAAALFADSCRIYKDVDGIYTSDPRIDTSAQKLESISYQKMLELCDSGSGVLQRKSVELAEKYGIELHILSSFQLTSGTVIHK